MADTPAAPAPAAPSSPASESASDAALFDKFTRAHDDAVAQELGSDDASNDSRPAPTARDRSAVALAAGATTARAAEPRGADAHAGGDGSARHPGGASTDHAGAAADGSEREGAEGKADDAAAAEAPEAAAAPLSEADAIALARTAHAAGDTEGLDRALKAILPGSKGLSEFAVDGKRYAELRLVTSKAQKKLDARSAELDGRETNVQRGIAMVEQLVQRYEPFEQLARAVEKGDLEDFVDRFQKVTKHSLNDVVRRSLDKKLGKQVDPEVAALQRQLAEEKQARLDREEKEKQAREHRARSEQIQGHLAFLVETLGGHSDERVAALVSTNEGLREIFLEQKGAYDPRTRSTITPEAAARRVIERVSKQIEPWQKVLGRKALPAGSPTIVEAKGEPLPAATPRATPLGSSGAAPASGASGKKLSDTELFEKYERLAKLAGD